jgi:hypothetical protein
MTILSISISIQIKIIFGGSIMRFKLFVLVAILAICAFSINANAQQADGINFSLSLWSQTGYYAYDKDYAVSKGLNDGKSNLDLVQFGLNAGSGLGATGKKGNVYLDFSFNLWSSVAYTSRLNFTWKPGNGFELKAGKAFAPYCGATDINDNYNWDIMAQYSTFEGFPYLVQFSYMGVYLALLDCAVNLPASLPAGYETQNMTPKVAVGYIYGAAPGSPIYFSANLQAKTYKIEDAAGTLTQYDGKSVTAYRFSVDFVAKKLATMLDIIASAYYGTNAQQLGITNASGKSTVSTAVAVGGSIKNTVTMGGHADVAVYIPGTPHKAAVGLGYESSKPDVSGAKKDEEMEYFINFNYSLEDNFSIVPTFQVRDHMKNSTGGKEGKETWYGIAWNARM